MTMKATLLRLLIAAAATAAFAQAQNSDLGLLLGVGVSTHSSSISSGVISSSSVHGGGQINYAVQLRETVAGRLYLELPLVITGGAKSVVARGTVNSSVSDALFFTPGLRWKFSPAHRVSFYAAVGGGLGAFDRRSSFVGNGVVRSENGWAATGAIGFGGGLDLRITRLLSFRGEGRDEVTTGNIDGSHHHGLFMLGIALHF